MKMLNGIKYLTAFFSLGTCILANQLKNQNKHLAMDPFSPYDFERIGKQFYLFKNQIPFGPIRKLLTGKDIFITYNDFNGKCIVKFNEFQSHRLQITFISSLNYHEAYWNLIRLLPLLNLLDADIVVYYFSSNVKTIEKYSNENIQFKQINLKTDDLRFDTDMIITNSISCIHFLKLCIPVFVIGPMGIGGWVTPENLDFFLDNGFEGRPGGEFWEQLNILLLLEQINHFRSCINIEDVLYKNKILAEKLAFIPDSELPALRMKINQHIQILHSEIDRWNLKPNICAGISFRKESDTQLIYNTYFNNLLFAVDELLFFEFIDGNRTLRELFSLTNLDEHKFWETIHILVEDEVISY